MTIIQQPYMTKEETDLILGYIQKYKPAKFLEYGIGWSTYHFSRFDFIKEYYGVEHNNDWIKNIYPHVGENVKFFHCPLFWGEYKYANPICIQNYVVKDEIAPFDMIFIDGDYRYQCMEYASTHLTQKGVCLVHDTARKDIHKFFNKFKYHKILTLGEFNSNNDWHQGLTILWNFDGDV